MKAHHRYFGLLRALAVVALVALALMAAGCSLLRGSNDAPSTPVGIVGEITSLDRSTTPGAAIVILVEGDDQPPGAVSDKAMVSITEKTRIVRAGTRLTAEQLAVGLTVAVWFEGAVAESYPVQGSASYVEVR